MTIPHCAPRVASREAIIRVISDDGRWRDYPTTEATVEDMKVHVSLEQGTLCSCAHVIYLLWMTVLLGKINARCRRHSETVVGASS